MDLQPPKSSNYHTWTELCSLLLHGATVRRVPLGLLTDDHVLLEPPGRKLARAKLALHALVHGVDGRRLADQARFERRDLLRDGTEGCPPHPSLPVDVVVVLAARALAQLL
eukprot:scaffold34058_cov57-Phaeocystis_antarctica.AAC.1